MVAVAERETRRRAKTFSLATRSFLPDSPAVRAVLAEFRREGPVEHYSPHCLAVGLSLEQADALRSRLDAAGVPTLLLPDPTRVNPPPLVPVGRLEIRDDSVRIVDALGRSGVLPEERVYFVNAAAVCPGTSPSFVTLDLHVTGPWSDYRITPANYEPGTKLASLEPLSDLVRRLIERLKGVPAGRGVVSLAEGVAPSDSFTSLEAYDAYNLWLLQLTVSGVLKRPAVG
jgi:hypothetical protein